MGTALLERSRALAHATGARRIRTADQPGNYLAPGLDDRDSETIGWLERRGFARVGERLNLRVPLGENPLVSSGRAARLDAAVAARGYAVRRATGADTPPLLTMVRAEFGDAWAYEVERALDADPPGVRVALHQGAIVAFAAHDGNNRGLGWFGPGGTVPAHRRFGLGLALLVRSLLDVAAAGHADAIVPWVGPEDFYARAVGAVTDRHFVVLERPL